MCEQDKDVVYYLTLENENYQHPSIPKGVSEGILKGLYKIQNHTKPNIR